MNDKVTLRELKGEDRNSAMPVLEQSFEGWYQWHAKRTLRDIEKVLGAFIGDTVVGVSMLKMLDTHNGYVYYIAVSTDFRRRRVGSTLLEKSMDYFSEQGADIVFAGITVDNEESKALFGSHGFEQISFSELSKKFGRLHTVLLYRKMTIVSGEVVYLKRLTGKLAQ